MARWKNINGVLQKIAGSVRIDQVLNKLSRNAISNKAVSEKFEEVDLSLGIAADDIDALRTQLDDIFKPDIYDSYPGLQLIKFGPIVVAIFKGYVPLNSTLTIPAKYRPSAERTGSNVVTIMGILYASEGSNFTANADVVCATGKVDIGYKSSITERSHVITTNHAFYGTGVWVTDD